MIFDDTACTLGEGPLWHPGRGQLFWFDILNRRLLTREAERTRHWQFDTYVSAAGWVDDDRLLVASARELFLLDLQTGATDPVCPLEADDPVTRSNDGRADPWGGFWIGTMGIAAEPGAGAIYRYHKGELRKLFGGITISNAICFPPDGGHAVFTDTPRQQIMRVRLDSDGWPAGDPEVWIDVAGTPWRPDGAVFDAEGRFWNAQWGTGRVACYGPDGAFLDAIGFAATQTTCPAFGGPDLSTLFCTSAAEGLKHDLNPHQGKTFACASGTRGQAEHRVLL